MKRREFITLLGGGGVAIRSARTTAGSAGDWVSQQSIARRVIGRGCGVSARP